MITYETLEDGSLSGNGHGSIPTGHRLFEEAVQLVEGGEATINSYVAPTPYAPGYREQRSDAYKDQLSPEGSFETTVGDLMDALIKAYYGDATELDALSLTINTIKSTYPAV